MADTKRPTIRSHRRAVLRLARLVLIVAVVAGAVVEVVATRPAEARPASAPGTLMGTMLWAGTPITTANFGRLLTAPAVNVPGVGSATASFQSGSYQINAPAGVYELQASWSPFSWVTVPAGPTVTIVDGETTTADFDFAGEFGFVHGFVTFNGVNPVALGGASGKFSDGSNPDIPWLPKLIDGSLSAFLPPGHYTSNVQAASCNCDVGSFSVDVTAGVSTDLGTLDFSVSVTPTPSPTSTPTPTATPTLTTPCGSECDVTGFWHLDTTSGPPLPTGNCSMSLDQTDSTDFSGVLACTQGQSGTVTGTIDLSSRIVNVQAMIVGPPQLVVTGTVQISLDGNTMAGTWCAPGCASSGGLLNARVQASYSVPMTQASGGSLSTRSGGLAHRPSRRFAIGPDAYLAPRTLTSRAATRIWIATDGVRLWAERTSV